MKFYLVWDKKAQRYLGGNRGRSMTPSAYPRIYSTHRHAAAAVANFIPLTNGQPTWIDDPEGRMIFGRIRAVANPEYRKLTDEERKEKRKELFEIHEYDVDTYKVVG